MDENKEYTHIMVEYIWLDKFSDFRSKTRTLPNIDYLYSDNSVPKWSYNGYATGQAKISSSDIILTPVFVCLDPFRGAPHLLALCITHDFKNQPLMSNQRDWAVKVLSNPCANGDPAALFGFEQEFYLMTTSGRPIGFPNDGNPFLEGNYYCSVGAQHNFGREIMDELYQSLLYSNIKISGLNSEMGNSQWEFQIGPLPLLEAGDHLNVARYILIRIAEKYGIVVNFNPKPISGNWSGSGLHVNFSTNEMRSTGGFTDIEVAIDKLNTAHRRHMKYYGENNNDRLDGKNGSPCHRLFTSGISDRSASVRINQKTADDGKGYLEDRRPAANANPYVVGGLIYQTVCQNNTDIE